MGIKTYNPYTPSRRNMTGSDFSEITKSTPEKSLLAKKSKNAGRNNQGKITVRHHGGGEGRAPVGRPSPMTPWGKPAMGLKTRKAKKASNKLIVRRRNGKAIK